MCLCSEFIFSQLFLDNCIFTTELLNSSTVMLHHMENDELASLVSSVGGLLTNFIKLAVYFGEMANLVIFWQRT